MKNIKNSNKPSFFKNYSLKYLENLVMKSLIRITLK